MPETVDPALVKEFANRLLDIYNAGLNNLLGLCGSDRHDARARGAKLHLTAPSFETVILPRALLLRWRRFRHRVLVAVSQVGYANVTPDPRLKLAFILVLADVTAVAWVWVLLYHFI